MLQCIAEISVIIEFELHNVLLKSDNFLVKLNLFNCYKSGATMVKLIRLFLESVKFHSFN